MPPPRNTPDAAPIEIRVAPGEHTDIAYELLYEAVGFWIQGPPGTLEDLIRGVRQVWSDYAEGMEAAASFMRGELEDPR